MAKKIFFWVFTKLPFAGTKVDLALEDECLEFVWGAPQEWVWLLDATVPFFLWWVV